MYSSFYFLICETIVFVLFSDEVRIRNERFGFTKLNKIRFFGDHKREQIEKYKTTILSE